MRIFTDVEAKTYPPSWKNELPLAKGKPLPLEAFPLINDFEIVLEQIRGTSWGYHLAFFSEKRGYITSFPWWDHVELDLYRTGFRIPYEDFEQGWEIEIFPEGEYMYVLESDFDHPESGYHTWFRVGKTHYLNECKQPLKQAIKSFTWPIWSTMNRRISDRTKSIGAQGEQTKAGDGRREEIDAPVEDTWSVSQSKHTTSLKPKRVDH